MALKIELKQGERVIVGEALIANEGHRAHLSIKGDVPILREPDIMQTKDAVTPSQKVYLAIQTMYLAPDPDKHSDTYGKLAAEVMKTAPSTASYIVRINNNILTGSLYKALKEAKALIAYEQELMCDA